MNSLLGLLTLALSLAVPCIGTATFTGIVLSSSDGNATVHSTVFLVCVAGGTTAPRVTWQFNGANISNNSNSMSSDSSAVHTIYETQMIMNVSSGLNFTESILEICNIGFAEQGQYTCITSNAGVPSNSTIHVEVLEIPIDVQLIGNGMLSEFQLLILTCAATPTASITWKVNDSTIRNSSDSRITIYPLGSGADNYSISELVINNVGLSDSGNYSCTADNDGVRNSVTRSNLVDVSAAFSSIVLASESGDVTVFSTVILTCVAGGTVITPQVTWQFNGGTISNDTKYTIYNMPTEINNTNHNLVMSTLEICNIQFAQEGRYECITGHRDVISSRNITITLLERPFDVQITGEGDVNEFETLTLTCIANESANIMWRFDDGTNGERIVSSTRYNYVRDDSAITASSTLSIERAAESDGGTYTCVADTSGTRLPMTEDVTVTVHAIDACDANPCQNGGTCNDRINERGFDCVCTGEFEGQRCEHKIEVPEPDSPPIVIDQPRNTNVSLEMPINLTCTAEGHPAPTYEWYKDGELIRGESRSFLYIRESLPHNRGNYTCVAINSVGNGTSQEAELDIIGLVQYSAQINISASVDVTQFQEAIVGVIYTIMVNVSSVFSVKPLNLSTSNQSASVQLLITFQNVPSSEERMELLRRIESTVNSTIYSYEQYRNVVQLVQLNRYDGCNPEEYRGGLWPETRPGFTASVLCPCSERLSNLAGMMTRVCAGTFSQGASWDVFVDDRDCAVTMSEVTRQLCAIPENLDNATIEVQVNVSRIVEDITSVPENLTAPDISASVSTLVQLTEGATEDAELGMIYLSIVDNIQKVEPEVALESQRETDSSSKVLISLESFQDKVMLSDENSTNNETTATFAFRTFAIQIQEIDPATYEGQTFTVNLGAVENVSLDINGTIPDDSLDITDSAGSVSTSEDTASVELPTDLFESKDLCKTGDSIGQARFSYSVFLSDILFQSESDEQKNLKLGSIIVAPRIRCEGNVTLQTPITVTFRTNRMVEMNSSSSSCASWNSDVSRKWNLDDCKEVLTMTDDTNQKDSEEAPSMSNRRVVQYKQFAHFGLLFDSTLEPVEGPEAIALFVITCVGLAVSLICLIIFIISHLSSKKLRNNVHSQVLVNMSLALIGVYIVFMIGGYVTHLKVACIISSSLLQYFLLVFFGWTTVEVFWLYLITAKAIGYSSLKAKYTLKAGLPTWIIPLLIVVAGAGPGPSFYHHNYYCRSWEWPFYFGTILPICVLYLINWIMFFIIMAYIVKHTKDKSRSKVEQTKKKVFLAMSLAVLFGLGWGIGFTSTSRIPVKHIALVFQILFSVLVGSQGALIFLLHGVRNKDVRNLWKQGLSRIGGKSLIESMESWTKSSKAGSSRSAGTLSNTTGNLYSSSGEMSLSRKKPILDYSDHASESVAADHDITKAEIIL